MPERWPRRAIDGGGGAALRVSGFEKLPPRRFEPPAVPPDESKPPPALPATQPQEVKSPPPFVPVSRTGMGTVLVVDDEDRLIEHLRRLVDATTQRLKAEELSWEEARQLIVQTRKQVLELFPDKATTFDLIYGPRFRRVLIENYRLQ